MDAEHYTYFAFISYSRKDSRVARWLQRRLEWFRFPVKLVSEKERPVRWDERLSALCPWCGRRFPAGDGMLGRQIACPLDACGKQLQLNPFVASSDSSTPSSGDTNKNNFLL